MDLVQGVRPAESSFGEMIWNAHSLRAGSFTSQAASTWEIVFTKFEGKTLIAVRGPETKASRAEFPADAEFWGITFKLGAFMPHLPVKALLDRQDMILPEASRNSFWLHGSAWELPTADNADIFINRLARQGLLVRDPVVDAALQGQPPTLSPRSMQYRMLQATGLTHKTIQQIERARRAADLLKRGTPILDAAFQLGYFDQAHLTHSLKRFIGQTPAQIAHAA